MPWDTPDAIETKPASSQTRIIAWIVAALASLALVFAIAIDRRQPRLATQPSVTRPAHHS